MDEQKLNYYTDYSVQSLRVASPEMSAMVVQSYAD